MEIKVCYSPEVLEATVKYVARHNRFYEEAEHEVKASILSAMEELVKSFPKITYIARGGFYVWVESFTEEGINSDENVMNLEFMVDPALGMPEISFSYKIYDRKIP